LDEEKSKHLAQQNWFLAEHSFAYVLTFLAYLLKEVQQQSLAFVREECNKLDLTDLTD
jgi:regulator of sirC expression with transglutaminase-like and TPR domain